MPNDNEAGAILQPPRGLELRLRYVIPEDGHSDDWWIRRIKAGVSVSLELRPVEGGAMIGRCPAIPIGAGGESG